MEAGQDFRREIKVENGEEKRGWCERGDLNPYRFPYWILRAKTMNSKSPEIMAGSPATIHF